MMVETWTTTHPRKEGWFWLDNSGHREIVQVAYAAGIWWALMVLQKKGWPIVAAPNILWGPEVKEPD